MVQKTKAMLGHAKEIKRKSDGINLHKNATYRDKHDLDSEGNPKEKQFVHSSVRIKPLLGSSKLMKGDERVQVFADRIALEREKRIKLQDKMKIELTKIIEKINYEEIKARAVICAHDYNELAFETAGILLIRKENSNSGFALPKTKKKDVLLHCVVCSHLRRAGKDYLDALPFCSVGRGEGVEVLTFALEQ